MLQEVAAGQYNVLKGRQYYMKILTMLYDSVEQYCKNYEKNLIPVMRSQIFFKQLTKN